MVNGTECFLHGDKGSGGSQGSAINIEKSYGSAFLGHSHTPRIIRDTFSMGCLCELKLDYNIGSASSWLHCNGIIYPNGAKTLVIIIEGQWRN